MSTPPAPPPPRLSKGETTHPTSPSSHFGCNSLPPPVGASPSSLLPVNSGLPRAANPPRLVARGVVIEDKRDAADPHVRLVKASLARRVLHSLPRPALGATRSGDGEGACSPLTSGEASPLTRPAQPRSPLTRRDSPTWRPLAEPRRLFADAESEVRRQLFGGCKASSRSPLRGAEQVGLLGDLPPLSLAGEVEERRVNVGRTAFVSTLSEALFALRTPEQRRAVDGYVLVVRVMSKSGRLGRPHRFPFTAFHTGNGSLYSTRIELDSPIAVPVSGVVQLILANPNGTPLRMILFKYSLAGMPYETRTAVRLRLVTKQSKQVRYGVHLNFARRLPSRSAGAQAENPSRKRRSSSSRRRRGHELHASLRFFFSSQVPDGGEDDVEPVYDYLAEERKARFFPLQTLHMSTRGPVPKPRKHLGPLFIRTRPTSSNSNDGGAEARAGVAVERLTAAGPKLVRAPSAGEVELDGSSEQLSSCPPSLERAVSCPSELSSSTPSNSYLKCNLQE